MFSGRSTSALQPYCLLSGRIVGLGWDGGALPGGVTVDLFSAGFGEKPFDVRSKRRSGSSEGTNKRIS